MVERRRYLMALACCLFLSMRGLLGMEVDLLQDTKEALFKAVTNDDLLGIQKLIQKEELSEQRKKDLLNAQSESDGETLLIRAITADKPKIIGWLLSQNDTNLNLQDNDGNTALHVAAILSDEKRGIGITKALLDKGADAQIANKEGQTSLARAKQEKKEEIIKVLTFAEEKEALFRAVGANDKDTIESLISAKKDKLDKTLLLNAKDTFGNTPFHLAVFLARNEAALKLIELGCNINLTDNQKNTPLHTALKSANAIIVEKLIEKGANLESQNNDGETPLFSAIRGKSQHLCKLLVDKKVNIKVVNANKITPLHIACTLGEVGIVKMLLDAGAHVNSVDNLEWSPLHYAVNADREDNKIEIVKALLKEGADAGIPNEDKESPLNFAEQTNNSDLVDILKKDLEKKLATKKSDKAEPGLQLEALKGVMEALEKKLSSLSLSLESLSKKVKMP